MGSPGTVMARFRQLLASGNAFDTLRRHAAMSVDQAWVLSRHHVARVSGRHQPDSFDGTVRIGLITVNHRTTRFLKLLLLTLAEQSAAGNVRRIVIVDNGSDEHDVAFLRRLTTVLPKVELVERHHLLDHARGLRAGVRWLTIVDREVDPEDRCNVLLVCDTDVVFRSPDALHDLASTIIQDDAALVGEWRGGPDDPDIQASFLAVRRDAYDRRDVIPPVHHGSPTHWMQRSIVRVNGLRVADFPSNHGRHILHRGRSAVAMQRSVRHPTASDAGTAPHFMGVPDGERIWTEVEARFAALLTADAEAALLDHLVAQRLGVRDPGFGADSDAGDQPYDPAIPVGWSPGLLQRRTLDSVLVLRPPGEPVLLSGVAGVLWSLFQVPTPPADVIVAVMDSFGLDAALAADDVATFVRPLLAAGVLRREGATTG